jgi:hypothetical protein
MATTTTRTSKTTKSKAKAPAKKKGPVKKKATSSMPSKGNVRAAQADDTASALIDERIRSLDGWRGVTLARMRALILDADPNMLEEWKWTTPVWSHDGIVCTGEAYKNVVKLTFARGASVPDPSGLFNSSLEGNTRRAIDIREGETIDAKAFKALIKAAVATNSTPSKWAALGAKSKPVKKDAAKTTSTPPKKAKAPTKKKPLASK